ncbi:MAG TPA: alpha/beta hydrolase [Thermomicrobiaceae bacterium]|nr:alpha/beta hydrolase [Thermomicrobiaceae bacterium]
MEGRLAVPGGELYYRVDDFTDPWRPRQTILLVHSAAGNVERWRCWIPTLARRYRVVRFDLRGHGRSSTPPPDYQWSIARLARDIRDLIDALGTGPVHYVGNSAGGIIGLQFVHDEPEYVRSLTLIGATPQLSRAKVSLAEWIERTERLGVRGFFRSDAATRFSPQAAPGLLEWFADETAKTPQPVVTSFIPYMNSLDLWPLLSEIETPTLLVAAEDDQITPVEVQLEMQAAIPLARLILYPTSGHNIGDEFPDRCAADTLAFIDEIVAGERAEVPRE